MSDLKNSFEQGNWEYYANCAARARESIATWSKYLDREGISDIARNRVDEAGKALEDCIRRYPCLGKEG